MEINFPKLEKKILKFWQRNKIFEKSIKKRKAKDFVFYEGPPTANAKPGLHHVLARIFKDIICRYKTMRGFRVLRKAGWDTHGLPVELEIERKLGLRAKKDIEKYGIAKFNKKCKESVWQYKKDWERLTERIGFWLDINHPYITYEPEYIESVWWILKRIWQKGLFYQDYKVVPYCPRCGTSLSSHEVALGYEKIKEPAIYLRFKIKDLRFKNSYLLVWTTTPWTLPGNVAVAVNPEFTYAKVKVDNEFLILAKERTEPCQIKGKIVQEFKGKDLVGLKYEGLYPLDKEISKHAYKVIAGVFVSLEEGTGLVHIAPAFGEEDMELIKIKNQKSKIKNEPEFPILLTVDEEGKFTFEVKKWAGMFVKEADPLIIENLKSRNLLFKEEIYEHDYPFCWRCNSPLLYYAKQSWFINMQKVKKDLIKNNQKINWIPAHLKEGRFGEWLREIKDWAFSRERYWGTPLPIWQCQIGKNQKSKIKNQKYCDNIVVIGSLKDLLNQKFSTNKYYLFRHGHSLRQVTNLASCWPEKSPFPLTDKGKREVLERAKKLNTKKIDPVRSKSPKATAVLPSAERTSNGVDLILSSDLLRARETAQILSQETGAKIIFDKRLREVNVGIFNGQNPKLAWDYIFKKKNPYLVKAPKGESLTEVRKRVYNFIQEINEKYQGKNIVIVSHEFPLTVLEKTLTGFSLKEIIKWRRENRAQLIKPGSWRKIEFKKLPFNEKMEIDFHRPYIDEVKFYCQKCGSLMKRIPEVIDCWFDSGAMPFAQAHFPFACAQNKKLKIKNKKLTPPELFPADYISEGIDQTRGWFYTLLAISTLLGFGPSYKNVISLGHVLDEKGEKMSKSKGNVVDPWDIVEKYGTDAIRWYFYTVNQPGDSKLFSEKDIEEALRKFILTFWNCLSFFTAYANIPHFLRSWKMWYSRGNLNILDRWIVSKLSQLILNVTNSLEKYDVTGATRLIENFVINDLSLWYIRRSRRRFHPVAEQSSLRGKNDRKDYEEASQTLSFVLLNLSKLTAPFIPFLSEEIHKICSSPGDEQSVHLEDWSKANKKLINKNLEKKMEKVREIVTLALAERAKAGIKVRQPLAKLQIANGKLKIERELLDLIKEEVNVKEIIFGPKIKKEVELDTKITPELKEEGIIREVIRNIQEMRKIAGLKPKDKISINYFGEEELNKILEKNKEKILKEATVKDFVLKEKEEVFLAQKEILVDQQKLWLAIKKN